jgi:hypothetical protein
MCFQLTVCSAANAAARQRSQHQVWSGDPKVVRSRLSRLTTSQRPSCCNRSPGRSSACEAAPAQGRWRLLESRALLCTTEPFVVEVLAGALDEGHLRMLRRLVLGCQMIPLRGLSGYEEAATVYRSCRRAGLTLRRFVGHSRPFTSHNHGN